ncbi:MAG: carbohydrate ABC transporter permease, partial [Treponema sp.]|nr:carbohydrate ABC transporter permease [Treponema sp.]
MIRRSDYPVKRIFIQTLMLFLGLVAIVPIYVLMINATRSTEQINMGLSFIPGTNSLYNWNALTSRGFQLWHGFLNSTIISISATALCVYFSALTAYGLHIYRFKGRLAIWTIILIIMMLPGSLTFIGFYQLMARW